MQRVRRIADFQFGRGAGEALFPDQVTFSYSTTKRVRYVSLAKERLVTVRANDGRFTLGYPGAQALHAFLPAPANRVVIMEEAVPFVADGKNAMAKHVISSDPNIHAEDE
ncbi:MAG TPA: pseudouridine synthase, partial [Methanocorpusculum sp.]|nr:pseudouridine synthase [Methanocorpusculum sp.]